MANRSQFLILISLLPLIYAPNVFAYVGPGAGLSAIGAFLALVGAILLAVLGFFWYPIKRLFSRRRLANAPNDDELNASDEPERIQREADRVQRQAERAGENPDT